MCNVVTSRCVFPYVIAFNRSSHRITLSSFSVSQPRPDNFRTRDLTKPPCLEVVCLSSPDATGPAEDSKGVARVSLEDPGTEALLEGSLEPASPGEGMGKRLQ
jgi:hypothetical protein